MDGKKAVRKEWQHHFEWLYAATEISVAKARFIMADGTHMLHPMRARGGKIK